MAPKLYLHFGTHKTGTTTIQKFAEAHRDKLLQRGLLYPTYQAVIDEKPYAHHQFSKAVAEQGARLDFKAVKQLASAWYDQALAANADVLVSAESMYRMVMSGFNSWEQGREEYLKRLAEVFSNFDVCALIVFRRPDNFVHSLYQENVMQGLQNAKVPFEKFREEIIDPFLRYSDHARLISKYFTNVKVEIFETLCKNNQLSNNFFKLIGHDFSDLIEEKRIRKSLTAPETLAKFFLNKSGPTEKQSNVLVGWLQTEAVKKILGRQYDQTKYHLWESHQARQDFLASRNEDIQQLGEQFIPGSGEVFPLLVDTGHIGVPKLTDKTKSRLVKEAMFGLGVGDLPDSSKAYRK